MDYDDYFNEVWGNIPDTIVSQEMFNKNRDLISEITYEYYRLYQSSNFPSPKISSQLLSIMFKNLLLNGLR